MPQSQGPLRKIELLIGQSVPRLELRLAVITVIVAIANWLAGAPPHLLTAFVYTFVIGNFTASLMGALGVRIRSHSPARQWVSFVLFLIPVGHRGRQSRLGRHLLSSTC